MKKRDPKKTLIHLGIAVGFTFLMIALYSIIVEPMGAKMLFKRLGLPLTRLLFFILVGLSIGQIIESTGWLKILAGLFAPLFRFGHLGPYCSSAFTAAFFSGTTSNAMLRNFYESNKIDKRQLFLSNLVNHLPAYFLHLPTTVFIVIPLTGKAGIIYFGCTFLAVILRTTAFLFFGRITLAPLKSVNFQEPPNENNKKKHPKRSLFTTIRARLIRRILHITTFVLPIYTAVFLLNQGGFFTYLQEVMTRYITLTLLPIESLSLVILSFMAEFTSGFAAAGALLENGVLTVKQAVMALLIGNIVAFPIRALRHQLPRYMGIFSPKLGTQMLLMGQTFRITSLVLVGWGYYLFT